MAVLTSLAKVGSVCRLLTSLLLLPLAAAEWSVSLRVHTALAAIKGAVSSGTYSSPAVLVIKSAFCCHNARDPSGQRTADVLRSSRKEYAL